MKRLSSFDDVNSYSVCRVCIYVDGILFVVRSLHSYCVQVNFLNDGRRWSSLYAINIQYMLS